MRYTTLGSTELFVSELCLGTMTFGGSGPFHAMGNVGQADADAMLDRAFGAGINIVDTADTYSGDVVPMLASENLGLLVWSPPAGGLLNGKVTRDAQSAEGTRRSAMQFPPVDMSRAYDVIDVLRTLAEQKRASVAQLAVAWLLHQSRVTSVIVGARRVDQMNDDLGAIDVAFTPEELQRLDAVSQLPAEYPGWMLRLWGQARVDQLAKARNAHAA